MKKARILLVTTCVLVIGSYAYLAQSGLLELLSPSPAETYYNLLVRGFRAGHLSLQVETPPGLVALTNPYDPAANAPYRLRPYRLHDMVYYKGKLYLYHGVTPALVLFWPFAVLTGHYLLHRQAVAIFCAIGFLTSVGLLHGLWRRYFDQVSVWVVAACVVALGLATGAPILMSQGDVYQVPISCAYMMTMLALAAIWRALHEPERNCRWLAAASLAYGLAVGARPSLLFGMVVLLVPVVQAWRAGRKQIWALLLAAIAPAALVGMGLMLYNFLRFDNPFEFGWRYQLGGDSHPASARGFSLRFFWFNFRVYFLTSVGWGQQFPFVQKMTLPPVPPGHGAVEAPFGALINVPLTWLALAVPLAWRNRSAAEATSILRWFVTAVALLAGTGALAVSFFYYTSARYEVDFLPELLLLAVIGILALEQTLATRPMQRRVARLIWGLLLAFSVVFNLLASDVYHAEAHHVQGVTLFQEGKVSEAIKEYEEALRLYPEYAKAHLNLGIALEQTGRGQEAIEHYEQALHLDPDYAKVHYNLGIALEHAGKVQDAIGHYKEALRIDPDYVEARDAIARLTIPNQAPSGRSD